MFVKDDFVRYTALKKVIHDAKFEIKGEATIVVASLFQWFNELGKKIEGSMVEKAVKSGPQGPAMPVVVEPPIKPMDKKKKGE